MSANPLQQAIQLIKAGRRAEARALLEPLLQADPHEVAAWMWYVETWPTLPQKLQVLQACARHNPDHPLAVRALAGLRAQQPSPPEPAPPPASVRPRPVGRRGVGLWPIIIALAVLAAALLVVWLWRAKPASAEQPPD
jgi:ferric-dicitrate binding protein FerR (iron transport regulator)